MSNSYYLLNDHHDAIKLEGVSKYFDGPVKLRKPEVFDGILFLLCNKEDVHIAHLSLMHGIVPNIPGEERLMLKIAVNRILSCLLTYDVRIGDRLTTSIRFEAQGIKHPITLYFNNSVVARRLLRALRPELTEKVQSVEISDAPVPGDLSPPRPRNRFISLLKTAAAMVIGGILTFGGLYLSAEHDHAHSHPEQLSDLGDATRALREKQEEYRKMAPGLSAEDIRQRGLEAPVRGPDSSAPAETHARAPDPAGHWEAFGLKGGQK
jgi:hypothetical protein